MKLPFLKQTDKKGCVTEPFTRPGSSNNNPLAAPLVAKVTERVVGGDERVDVVAAERGRGIVAAVVQTRAPARNQVSRIT